MTLRLQISLLLVLLTVGTFWRVSRHDFINYDDPDYVTANAVVQAGLTPQGVEWAFKHVHGEKTYWHPLTWISHMVDVELFGLKPGGHHLMNLLWHSLNVLLLFHLLASLTGATWRSAAVAALFAVHPLQVDTVAWITERKNLLSTFFFLATLLAYRGYALGPSVGRYVPVFVLFALGLMTKPAIVTLPCVLLLLDFWPLRRFAFARKFGSPTAADAIPAASALRLVVEKLPLFALSAASSFITVMAHKGLGMVQEHAALSYVYRIENALVSYARYLGKAFWPTDLALLYPHPGSWPRWQVIACGALLLLITDQVIRHGRKQPAITTGWLWFLGTLVPMIGLLQVGIQAMADRFAYLPLIGLFIAVVWAAAELLSRFAAQKFAPVALGAVAIVACVVVTSLQLQHWKNSVTILSHTARVTKDNAQAYHNWGAALMEERKFAEAQGLFETAVRLKPNGMSYLALGNALQMQNRTNAALTNFMEAVNSAPAWHRARKELAGLQMQLGHTNAAISNYTALLQMTPYDLDANFYLGLLLASSGRVEEGAARYFAAVKMNPNHLPSLNNLAWILATSTNASLRLGPEAMAMAMHACRRTDWKQPEMIATLAAACAESGGFEDAIRYGEQALNLAKATRGTNDLASFEKMLNEFRAGRPYRTMD